MDFTDECPICLNEYQNNRYPIFLLPCKHVFCQECVSCLETKKCPLCRCDFNGSQKNSLLIKQFYLSFLNKMENDLNENFKNNSQIFNENKSNIIKIKDIFELNFNLLNSEDFKSNLKEIFEFKIKVFKADEISYYYSSLKYSSIKYSLSEKRKSIDMSCNDDFFFIDNKYLDEINQRIDDLIKENLKQHEELCDAKKFYETCYQEFVNKRFGYLETDLEFNLVVLEDHYKINNEIFKRNNELINEIINKIELKKLPKDIDRDKFREFVGEKLRFNESKETFLCFEKTYLDLKRQLKSKINVLNNFVELSENDLLYQKREMEELMEIIEHFIKRIRIEKLSFKSIDKTFITFLSEYRSIHSHKRFDRYKIMVHFLKI